MTGQTSDFLSSHAERALEIWRSQVGEPLDSPSGRGPKAFINAVLVALTADDLRPLLTYYEIESGKTAGVEERLDDAFAQIIVLLRVLDQIAEEDGLMPTARLDLALSAAEELGMVRRRLVQTTVGNLVAQLTSSRTTSTARGTSLSITMHELRRPLTILNSYAQLLSSGMLGVLPESASVAIEGITSSTEMMVRLVSALSELSRLEDPDDKMTVEDLSLGDIVNGALEPLATEARFRECVVEKDVDESVRIAGDRRRLTLALTNILSNALKHSPVNGVVRLRAWGDSNNAYFVVSDQGPGFPAEDEPHLFDKYFRSTAERHRKIPGSGLGLYIVKTVVERHGGRVAARSHVGHGAEFEISVPLPARVTSA